MTQQQQQQQQHVAASAAASAGKDLYAALEIAPSASEADIKKAYREQALRWHPDKAGECTDAKQRFQAISEAYEVLSDGDGKKWYDYLRASMSLPAAQQKEPRQTAETRSHWQAGAFAPGTGGFTPGTFHARARTSSGTEFYVQAAQAQAAQAAAVRQAAQQAFYQDVRGFTYAHMHGTTIPSGVATAHGVAFARRCGPRSSRRGGSAEVPPGSAPIPRQYSSPTASFGSKASAENARKSPSARTPQADPDVHMGRSATARGFPQDREQLGGTQRSKRAPEGMRRPATARGFQQAYSPHHRPTAAEVHPEGFDQPDFLATLGDLRAVASFMYAGRTWKPEQVTGVDWGRSETNPRDMRLSFSSEYLMPPAVMRTAPEYDLRKKQVQQMLSAAFKENLKDLLGSSVQSSSSLTIHPQLGAGNGLKNGGIPFSFSISMEGEPDAVLMSFQRARASGPAMKAKDCPIM